MKLYRVNDAGQLQSAVIPDGVLPIAVGATLDLDGKDRHPIKAIDFDRKRYWRGNPSGVGYDGGPGQPFPERWIGEAEINALPWSDEPPAPAARGRKP